MSQEDSHFLRTFASVVGGLVVFSILLGTIAAILQQQLDQEISEARLAAVEERIQPIGAVHTGETGQQGEQPEAAEPETAETEEAGAQPAESAGAEADEAASGEAGTADAEPRETAATGEDDAMAGEQVYQEVCATCHGTGVAGAPELTQDAWADRLEQGRDTLYKHSIEGYQGDAGFMPAKGGRADLSDEAVENAVDYMISEVEGG